METANAQEDYEELILPAVMNAIRNYTEYLDKNDPQNKRADHLRHLLERYDKTYGKNSTRGTTETGS